MPDSTARSPTFPKPSTSCGLLMSAALVPAVQDRAATRRTPRPAPFGCRSDHRPGQRGSPTAHSCPDSGPDRGGRPGCVRARMFPTIDGGWPAAPGVAYRGLAGCRWRSPRRRQRAARLSARRPFVLGQLTKLADRDRPGQCRPAADPAQPGTAARQWPGSAVPASRPAGPPEPRQRVKPRVTGAPGRARRLAPPAREGRAR